MFILVNFYLEHKKKKVQLFAGRACGFPWSLQLGSFITLAAHFIAQLT